MAVEMARKAPTKPKFGTLNEHLVCTLCKGYLVDATTIVECLHSYCRSCIVQYLQASSFCPRCEVQLHKGSPLRSLKPDKTLQDIVFKLVPNLFHNEMQRRRVYYDAHPQYVDQTTPEQRGDCLERFYSPDDPISLSLEYHDRRKPTGKPNADKEKTLPPKRYLKCPALFTVGLLKKFVRYKFDLPQEIVIDIFQRRESLADEYTLLDIAYIYPWKRSEPMQFFYRVRDPRVPESDEEVEREMPSLSAAVCGRTTRSSRRASSASSLASPLASPRGSPVPCAKRGRVDLEGKDKDLDKQDTSPPPAKLTSQPPKDSAVHPKAVVAKPVTPPKVTSPTSNGPKITLTISPSRGTVTTTTTPRQDAVKSPPPTAVATPKPVTTQVLPTTPTSMAPAPIKKSSSNVNNPAVARVGSGTPKPFAATVTTKTANGGFVTVKNPIARAANGVTLGAKTPIGPSVHATIGASTKMTPILPKPAGGPLKGKRLTNGMPLLAAKTTPKTTTTTLSPAANGQAPPRTTTSTTGNKTADASNKRPQVAVSNGRPAASPAAVGKEGVAVQPKAQLPVASNLDEEKNKVETAKAILQLSMGFKHGSRSNTPTDTTLHNRIDKIVKDLQDDESNDGTLVIKSEPPSPSASPAPSNGSRGSPVPPSATASVTPASLTPASLTPASLTPASLTPATLTPATLTPASLTPATLTPATLTPASLTTPSTPSARIQNPPTPTLPKVNGLTITPIDPAKRKSTSSPSFEEKRPRLEATPSTVAKRPSDGPLFAPSQAKLAKVDKIADSIKQKQELLRRQQQQRDGQKEVQQGVQARRPPTPRPQTPQLAGQANNLLKPQPQMAKPALNAAKPPSPLSTQPTTQPPTQSSKQAMTQSPKQAPTPPQTTMTAVKTFPPAQVRRVLPKPPVAPVSSKQTVPQAQSKSATTTSDLPPPTMASMTPPMPVAPPKPSPPVQQSQQAFKTAGATQGQQNRPPTPAPQSQPSKPTSVQQSKPRPAQQNLQPKPVSVQQSKPSPAQQNLQPKPASVQQSKPSPVQQSQLAKPFPLQPNLQTQQAKTVAATTPLPHKSPESPVKNKKPIPDLQRLQRPLSGLSGTTVNGSLSLAEVKEQLAKKGQYSPPPPNKTPPRLIELSQVQRKALPASTAAARGPRDGYGPLDLSSASPRAPDHGGSWTPPPSLGPLLGPTLAQTLAKRQQLMLAPQSLPALPLRPPPSSLSSLSSSSPSPPADSPGSSSVSPELFLEQSMLAQHAAVLQHLQLQSLFQAQAGMSAGLKKAIEDWTSADRVGVKAMAKRK